MKFRRPRPSLVRRLTVGFWLASAASVMFFLLGLLYLVVLTEGDEPAGPEIAIAHIQHDLSIDVSGMPVLAQGGRFESFAARHQDAWFLIEGSGGTLSRGSVPPQLLDQPDWTRGSVFKARYRNLGSDGPKGHAATEELEVDGQSLRVTAGGVRHGAIGYGHFLIYLQHSELLWAPLFMAIFALAGAAIAIPILVRSLRPTAQAAAELDPADLNRRLPEKGTPKELLPIVRAFNAALDRLAEEFERRRRFIADVAHELRTPLAVLNMHVDALPDQGKKPDLQRIVYRLGQMVGQMLDAERLTLAGRQQEEVDLVELSKAAVADIAPLAVANGYDIAFNAEQSPVKVRGDPHSITRAITNLLGNAIAHGGQAGTIEVRVLSKGAVDVSDEGSGIPVEARERIFEPFRRERWDRDGCGLGLHLVREIMIAHGGTAKVVNGTGGAKLRLQFQV